MGLGTALPLVSLVAAIASAQIGAGRSEPRGLRLGRTTLWVGALLLVAGLIAPVPLLLHLARPAPLLAEIRLSPIFVAIGVVLLQASVVALHPASAERPRILTLGEATLRMGLVLLVLGCLLPAALFAVDSRGMGGMLAVIIGMDSLPAGVATLALGFAIWVMQGPSRQGG
jgi:hypothetical protein